MTISKLMFQHIREQIKETDGTFYTYSELADILGRSEATVRDAVNVMDILGEIYISPGRPIRFKYIPNDLVPEPGTIQKTIVTEQVVKKNPEISSKKMVEIEEALKSRIERDRPLDSLRPAPLIANAIADMIEGKRKPLEVYSYLVSAAEHLAIAYLDNSTDIDPAAIV